MQPETIEAIKAHAVKSYPKESCGLVAVVKGRERYFPCENKAETPDDHFVLSGEDYAHIEDQGEIIALAHSHPGLPARPSQADRVQCESSGLPWYIVSVMIPDGKEEPEAVDVYSFAPEGYEASYSGRQFHHGVLDCYSLIRDFYKREFDVELSDFDRSYEWWNKGQDLYFDNFRKEGFEIITDEPKYGDVILMQLRADVANHGAIYLGDGLILHHVANRLSSRDIYGGYWVENTRAIIRRVSHK